jgi:arsenate reductase
MKKITVYGIPNCDITKLALAWLKKNKMGFEFHDYKKCGITSTKLNEWSKKIPWETILNKRGTTWKKIDPQIQQTIVNQKNAVQLMKEHTSLIKRPVIEINDSLLIGFDEVAYNNKLLNG